MDGRNILPVAVVAAFGLALLAGGAMAAPKGKINKNQLVGDWSFASVNAPNAAIQNKPGDGYVVFERNGRFSFNLLNGEIPKFSSNNRNTGTAEENKAVVQGSISYFGTYSVNEADSTMTLHIERCSFPNWNGTDQIRQITSLTAQELKYTNPTASFGGAAELTWKRMR
jgi:Lipocalin-like domain